MSPNRWLATLVIFVAGVLANEALPLLLGAGTLANGDWSLLYVTLRFVALPAGSLMILVLVAVHVGRRRTLPMWAAVTGAAALLYLVSLVAWPVPWIAYGLEGRHAP